MRAKGSFKNFYFSKNEKIMRIIFFAMLSVLTGASICFGDLHRKGSCEDMIKLIDFDQSDITEQFFRYHDALSNCYLDSCLNSPSTEIIVRERFCSSAVHHRKMADMSFENMIVDVKNNCCLSPERKRAAKEAMDRLLESAKQFCAKYPDGPGCPDNN